MQLMHIALTGGPEAGLTNLLYHLQNASCGSCRGTPFHGMQT